MKELLYIICHLINIGVFLYLYRFCIECDMIVSDDISHTVIMQFKIYPFMAELIFLYIVTGLLIVRLFNKYSALECVIAYFGTINMVIFQYRKILEGRINIYNELWYNDAESITIKIAILCLIGLVIIIMFLLKNNDYDDVVLNGDFLFIIMLYILGVFVFITGNNLFILYLGVELQSLALYIMCSLKRYSNKSLEAGFKYYLYGSFSSAILLLGISFLYGAVGTLDLNDVALIIKTNDFQVFYQVLLHAGLICILASFLFKLAVFPFHWWLADVYEGTADSVTFFLAVVTKLPFFFVLYKLFINIFSLYVFYGYILMFCGLMSVVVGTILALYEVKLKKLFAYSSIVHMGYIIISLSLGSKIGIIVSFYYFFIYIVTTIFIFSIFLVIRFSNSTTFRNITDFVYLRHNNKWLALCAMTALLSLAGVPPLIGFYGKLYVFYILINSGNYYICFILLLLSILSCVYYIRLIRFIFFDEKTFEPMVFLKKQSIYLYYIIAAFFLINISFFFFQEPILIYIISIFL